MPMFRKSGGSFKGRITEVTFDTKEWESAAGKAYHTFSAKVVIDKDGADEPVEQYLAAGFAYPDDGQTVSDDGTTLEGGLLVDESSEFAGLVQSAVENGVPEADLMDEDGNATNFSALTRYRYEFGRVLDRERQLASGRKKLKIEDPDGFVAKGGKTYTEADIMKAGQRKSKSDGKMYNQMRLVITAVIGQVETKMTKSASKNTAKATTTKATTKSKAPEVADDDIPFELVDALLTSMLELVKGDDKVLKTAQLKSVVVRMAAAERLPEGLDRDVALSVIDTPDFLSRNTNWEYDAKAKTVTLAQVEA